MNEQEEREGTAQPQQVGLGFLRLLVGKPAFFGQIPAKKD